MDWKGQLKACQLIRQLLNHAKIHNNKFSVHFSQVKYLEQYNLEYETFPFLQVCLKHLTWRTTRTGIQLLLTHNSLIKLVFNSQA